MENIRKLENDLFTRWQAVQGYKSFAQDGLINPDVWDKTPIKILYVLKEVNHPIGNFDLRVFLQSGGNWKTWNNVARWTQAILDGGDYPRHVSKEDRIRLLAHVCAMNLKKVGGDSKAEENTIRKFTNCDRSFIREQILLYKPDVIICCGGSKNMISELLREFVFNDCEEIQNSINEYLYYTHFQNRDKKTLVVSFHHPQKRASHLEYEK